MLYLNVESIDFKGKLVIRGMCDSHCSARVKLAEAFEISRGWNFLRWKIETWIIKLILMIGFRVLEEFYYF